MTAKSSKLVKVDVVPGIVRNYTPVESERFYVDCDKVRFREGRPQKLGGWAEELVSNSIIGCARSLKSWQALDTTLHLAVGTHNHLYIGTGGSYFDITPIRATSSLTDPLTTTLGSAEVNIEDTLHSATEGDYIYFPADVTFNGITLSGEYVITSVVDADNYTIEATDVATGSGTGGGSFNIQYYIESGLCDSGPSGFGWGAGTWSDSTWGTPRSTGVNADARIWSLENFGEDLLALPSGGALYYWDTSGGTSGRATVVSTAPSQSNWMIMTSYFRQCLLLGTEDISGTYDPLLIRWSDNEDYTQYDPTVDGSNAGEYRLTKGTKIISAIETRNGEILVFTDKAVYRMRPRNDDLVYEVTLLSDTSGIIAPKAVKDVDGRVFWASDEGFRFYDGVVRILPSTLDLFYFEPSSEGYYNETQKVKSFVGRNRQYDELWFFFADKNNNEINRYVIYNYKEDVFYDGMLTRTAWEDAFVYDRPYAFDDENKLFAHEVTFNDNGGPMNSYLTTGFFKVGDDGNNMLFVDRFILDGEYQRNLSLTLDYKQFPNSLETFSKEYPFESDTTQIPVRARGRYLSYTITSNTVDGYFKLGEVLASVQPAGRR